MGAGGLDDDDDEEEGEEGELLRPMVVAKVKIEERHKAKFEEAPLFVPPFIQNILPL